MLNTFSFGCLQNLTKQKSTTVEIIGICFIGTIVWREIICPEKLKAGFSGQRAVAIAGLVYLQIRLPLIFGQVPDRGLSFKHLYLSILRSSFILSFSFLFDRWKVGTFAPFPPPSLSKLPLYVLCKCTKVKTSY